MNNLQADIVFRHAHLENSLAPLDLAVKDGVILAIEADFNGRGVQEFEAEGLMVSPMFIDPHHHLDCAYLDKPINHSGTLQEAIRINAAIKADREYDEIYQKACLALEQALLNGTGWIRSHGDVDSTSKLCLMHPILEAKERFRDLVDVQFVAFPQLGLVRDPGSVDYLRAAMSEGADVVGGMPHHEATFEDAARHIEICFRIAKEFDADIDMHIDENDDPESRTLGLLAEFTIREDYQGRVTAGHCCALAAYDDEYARQVIDKVAEARLNVVTNPLVNLHLQGREDSQPVRRGITRVKELLSAGVNVTCGLDDVGNMFFPFGRMDMLEVAMITSVTAHLATPEGIQTAFDMPRERAAKTLRLENYRLTVGAPANLVLFAADNAQEALRLQPMRRFVVRRGRIVASNLVKRSLHLR